MLRLFALMVFTSLPCLSWADVYDAPKVVALESRLYNIKYDLSPMVGMYPLDAFNKSLVVGLSLTNYIQPYMGWEIFNIQYSKNIETDLKDQLVEVGNVRPKGLLDYINWAAYTSYVYTPFYSKNLAFNRSIVHSEMSLVAGPGLVRFESGDNAVALGGGGILRFFLNDRYSVKFDSRLYYHNGEQQNTNFILMVNFALGIAMGSSDK